MEGLVAGFVVLIAGGAVLAVLVARSFARHEERIRADEERLARVLETTADGIVVVDRHGRVEYANSAAERILGRAGPGVRGVPVADLLQAWVPLDGPPAAREASPAVSEGEGSAGPPLEEPVRRAMRTGETVQGMEFAVPGAAGGRRRVAVSAAPLVDRRRGVTGAVASLTDVTLARAAEQTLARHARELARSNAELEQFAYVASHDLQEPLRMVASYTQLLASRYRGGSTRTPTSSSHYAVDGATRMQRLIEDLLAYSRVGPAARPPLRSTVDAVIDRALANLQAAIEEAGAVVTHDPLPTIVADDGPARPAVPEPDRQRHQVPRRTSRRASTSVPSRTRGGLDVLGPRQRHRASSPSTPSAIFVIFQRLHTPTRVPGDGDRACVCQARRRAATAAGSGSNRSPGGGATFRFTLPAEASPGAGDT